MLMLVMVLGELLTTREWWVVWARHCFCFADAFLYPFLRSGPSPSSQHHCTPQDFLTSGFPIEVRLGVWSLVNFLNQRHFASAIGLLLLVLVFIVDRYRRATLCRSMASTPPPSRSFTESTSRCFGLSEGCQAKRSWKSLLWDVRGFVFAGALLKLMPLWNGAVFIAAPPVCWCCFAVPIAPGRCSRWPQPQQSWRCRGLSIRTDHVRKAVLLFHWGYTWKDRRS